MSNTANHSQKQAARNTSRPSTSASLPIAETLKGFGKLEGYKKDELMQYMQHVKENIVKEFNFGQPNQVIQAKDECVIWIQSKGKAVNNEPYKNEHIFLIKFERDTDKFINVVEMMDSLFVEELQDRLKKN